MSLFETTHSSISKQPNVRMTDDYFQALKPVKGLSAVRTLESGIMECMMDPGLAKEADYKQHETTSKMFHTHKKSTSTVLSDASSPRDGN